MFGTYGVIVGSVETVGSAGRMKKNNVNIQTNKNKKKIGMTRVCFFLGIGVAIFANLSSSGMESLMMLAFGGGRNSHDCKTAEVTGATFPEASGEILSIEICKESASDDSNSV